MSPLKYQCVHCHTQWGELQAGDDNISHGICRRCLRELQKDTVRRRQRREGYSPCYAQGHEDCTEFVCAFYNSCREAEVIGWEKEKGINGKVTVKEGGVKA
jgi:hypothetical protein